MIKQTYFCDSCGSEGQDEAYRQDPANFTQYNLNINSVSGGGPEGYQQTTKHVCAECKPTVDLTALFSA